MSATITRLPSVKAPNSKGAVAKPVGNHFGNHLASAGSPTTVGADPKEAATGLGKVVKEGGKKQPSTVERLLADNSGSKALKPYEKILLRELKEARDALLPEADRVMRQLLS